MLIATLKRDETLLRIATRWCKYWDHRQLDSISCINHRETGGQRKSICPLSLNADLYVSGRKYPVTRGVFMAAVLGGYTTICRPRFLYSITRILFVLSWESTRVILVKDSTHYRLREWKLPSCTSEDARLRFLSLRVSVYNLLVVRLSRTYKLQTHKNLRRHLFFVVLSCKPSYIRTTTRRAHYKSYHPREIRFTGDREDAESKN